MAQTLLPLLTVGGQDKGTEETTANKNNKAGPSFEGLPFAWEGKE